MSGSLLVIGGGIAGMTSALEAAECGLKVHLVEKDFSLGGRVLRMNRYFPKLCPPACGVEINYRRLRSNPDVEVLTNSEVVSISGVRGEFSVVVETSPRYVNARCTACGDCEKVCPVKGKDPHNYGLSEITAIRAPHKMAMPMRYAIDMDVCEGESCGKCVTACKYGAVDFAMKPVRTTLVVGSVIYATGWKPYDAGKIENLGYGKIANVVTNVEMERLAAPDGPNGGAIMDKPVKKVAFVQCAGSRDENHLPYCSSVCCMASLKQATYVRERYPDSEVYIFYIDLRASGKYQLFQDKLMGDSNVHFIKGKVAKVEDGEHGQAVVVAEDILGGEKIRVAVDLVVLATGMEPVTTRDERLPDRDEYGFISANQGRNGIHSVGVAKSPVDVTTTIRDATGSVVKALCL